MTLHYNDLVTVGMIPSIAEYLTDMSQPPLELIDGKIYFDYENQNMSLSELVNEANEAYTNNPGDFEL